MLKGFRLFSCGGVKGRKRATEKEIHSSLAQLDEDNQEPSETNQREGDEGKEHDLDSAFRKVMAS
uniref:Uncharacterized protein n=1 Tax=Oryza rufipogon TaxID=4529 RepID=A0A0E0PG02_ORYRU